MQQLKSIHSALLYVCATLMAWITLPADAQQKGKATFYSRRANGARSASGERIHSDSLVCAHRTHPFGTLLKVRNPANGKEVVVRVIDRGPFARGRVIDLSLRAARELGIVSQGVAMVEVSVYKRKVEVPYKPDDDIDLPELDMEVTEPEQSASPQWQHNDKEKETTRQTIAPVTTTNHAPNKPEKQTGKAEKASTKIVKPLSKSDQSPSATTSKQQAKARHSGATKSKR